MQILKILLVWLSSSYGVFYLVDIISRRSVTHGDTRAFYADIAIGSLSRPVRVHENTRCIVIVKSRDLKSVPYPFLNRFEKVLIGPSSISDRLSASFASLSSPLSGLASYFETDLKEFVDVIGVRNFYGAYPSNQSGIDTIRSLVISSFASFAHFGQFPFIRLYRVFFWDRY